MLIGAHQPRSVNNMKDANTKFSIITGHRVFGYLFIYIYTANCLLGPANKNILPLKLRHTQFARNYLLGPEVFTIFLINMFQHPPGTIIRDSLESQPGIVQGDRSYQELST